MAYRINLQENRLSAHKHTSFTTIKIANYDIMAPSDSTLLPETTVLQLHSQPVQLQMKIQNILM